MKLRLICFFVFMLMIDVSSNAQLQQVIPPSPITREFDKYIKNNVSFCHGLPDIDIPLYEIKVKGLTIPISLSYHASGIKYKQTSGEVGVGWVLNPRYRISKTAYGTVDNGGVSSPFTTSISSFPSMTARDKYFSSFVNGDYNILLPQASEIRNGEYDVYNYAVGNSSGTFIITDAATSQVEFLDSRKIKVTKTPTTSANYFEVLDADGVKYKIGTSTGFMEATGTTGLGWMATQITTPFNDQVQIDYASGFVPEYQNHLLYATVHDDLGSGYDLDGNLVGLPTAVSYNAPQSSGYLTSFISTISTDNETLNFFRDQSGNLLNAIEIKNSEQQLIKRIEFSYTTNEDFTFLDKVSIYPNDNASPQVFSFEYYEGSPLLQIPILITGGTSIRIIRLIHPIYCLWP